MRNRIFTLLFMIASASLLGGCAIGSKMDYAATRLELPALSSSEIVVAVWDQRPYVVSGDKSPQFVGLQRSGFGIPYGVHTDSGEPLSDEFAKTIHGSFSSQGINVKIVPISPGTKSRTEVGKLLSQNRAEKTLLLTLQEWQSDTMVNVNFKYHLKAEVIGNRGNIVGQASVEGDEKLDASFWNPVGSSERVMVKKQKEKLEELFKKPGISSAL